MLSDTTVTAKTVNSFKTKLETESKTNMGLFLDWSPLNLEAVTEIRSGHPASILQVYSATYGKKCYEKGSAISERPHDAW